MKYFPIVTIVFFSLMSCEKEKSQAEKDDEIIRSYLSENSREAELHSSGLYYQILEEGTGGYPEAADTIIVKFKGYLTNNVVFDQTEGNEVFEYPLQNLIPGWQVGLPLIQRGGREILYIPSVLAYGSYSNDRIPPYSVLIFEIELIDFY
jgi:FKBP-type peptidyl-prolyl cis-trans isomerase